jgi:hypothetical protein
MRKTMKLPAYVVCWSANLGPMGRTSNWDFVNEEEIVELVEWLDENGDDLIVFRTSDVLSEAEIDEIVLSD